MQMQRKQHVVTPFEIVKLESALAARARDLARSLAERNQITIERSADEVDNALQAAERESSAQALSQDLRLLRQVEAARDRLRASTYGVCLRCEESIAPQRLQAIPWAPYCLSCQASVEDSPTCTSRTAQAA